jgi:hypothetical protein
MVARCSSRRPLAEHMHYTPGPWGRRVAVAAAAQCVATAAGAQQDRPSPRSWAFGVATGPTMFYGDEGNTVGLNIESVIARRLGARQSWLRAELSTHMFGAQRLYPCSLSINATCFTTSQRSVVGVGLSFQQFVGKDGDGMGRSHSYFSLGAQLLASARTAEKIAECTPDGTLCPAEPIRANLTNTDIGVTAGIGHAWSLGARSFFMETRLLQPVTSQVGTNTRFRLMPFTLGMRF